MPATPHSDAFSMLMRLQKQSNSLPQTNPQPQTIMDKVHNQQLQQSVVEQTKADADPWETPPQPEDSHFSASQIEQFAAEDPEWIRKLEMDLEAAARLEEDLQVLCAMRQQQPVRNEHADRDERSSTTTTSDTTGFRRNHKSAGPHLHNSRPLDTLKVEGKNSFNIPCTDIYDEDFEEELRALLKGTGGRMGGFPRYSKSGSEKPGPSRLILNGGEFSCFYLQLNN